MFEATCWSTKSLGVQWLNGCSLLCVSLDWSWHGYLMIFWGILGDIYPKLPKLPPGFSMDSCRSTSTCRKKKLPTDPPLLRLRANEGQFVRFLFAFLQMHMLSHFLILLVSGSTGSMADSTWFNEANAPSIPGITWQVWASWWGIYVDVPFFESFSSVGLYQHCGFTLHRNAKTWMQGGGILSTPCWFWQSATGTSEIVLGGKLIDFIEKDVYRQGYMLPFSSTIISIYCRYPGLQDCLGGMTQPISYSRKKEPDKLQRYTHRWVCLFSDRRQVTCPQYTLIQLFPL